MTDESVTMFSYQGEPSMGLSSGPGRKKFPLLHVLLISSEHAKPPIRIVTTSISQEVKRWDREAAHLPSTTAEVKNTRIYTSIPPCAFMASCFIN
jgi:hypothetical protein